MKRWVSMGALAAAMAVAGDVQAQDTEWNRYTLEDLGGVFIRLEANDACTAAGVTPATYEADVSLKLIEAEVGVLTQEEMLANPAMPELRISLDCATGSDQLAYSVALRVQQAAQMLRDTQITLSESVTWFSTDVGLTSSGGASDAIGSTLMAKIDEFATAWNAINATEGEGGS